MSRLSRGFLFWALLSIAAGIILRVLFLNDRPYGVDGDQALVVLQGLDDLRAGRWALFQPQMTRFETFTAYFYALSWKAFGSARVLALALSLAELALLYLVVRRESGARAALLSVMILAVLPWHWFYSRVTGPCVGAGLILLLYWLWRRRPARFFVLLGGWFYYGLLRLLWLWELRHFRERRWRLFYGVAAVAVIALSLLSGLSFFEIVSRGDYNHPLSFSAISLRLENWFRLWFFVPGTALREGGDGLIVDPVSSGFSLLSTQPFLSGAGALLLLTLAGTALFDGDFRRRWREPLGLLGLAMAALVFSPTPSHGLMWLPLFAWMGAEALLKAPRGWGVLLILALPLNGLWQSADLLEKMKPNGVAREIFEDRWRWLVESEGPKFPAERFQVYLIAERSFLSARFEALRSPGWIPLLGSDPQQLEALLRNNSVDRREQVIILDRGRPHLPAHFEEAFWEGYSKIGALEDRLRTGAEILESRALEVDGVTQFRLYRIRWR